MNSFENQDNKELPPSPEENITQNPESLKQANERLVESLSIKTEAIQGRLQEVGGIEGISQTINEMPDNERSILMEKISLLQEQISKKREIISRGGDTVIDESFGIGESLFLDGMIDKDPRHNPLPMVIMRPLSLVSRLYGVAIMASFAPMKGAVEVSRRISLGLDNLKMRKLQSKV